LYEQNQIFSPVIDIVNDTSSVADCSGNRPMNVDELLMNAESLAGETVIVEGLCTHVCDKSGMKLFLQGTDKTQTLRAESDATLGQI